MIDCLLIGHNEGNFVEYEKMVKAMGVKSGAFRDLNLNYIEYQGKPYRAMDIINYAHFGESYQVANSTYANPTDTRKPFYNGDFLSPAILVLGSFLHKQGFSFDYVNSFNYEQEELRAKLEQDNILTIGITTTLYVSVKPIVEIIEFIRRYNKRAKIIIGGPFIATQMRQADQVTMQYLFKALGADFYINSIEGEGALVNILAALKQGTTYSTVNNIWYKSGDKYVATEVVEENNDLAENPINWSLFSKESIGEFVSLRTSRSCPFGCAFCGFPERAGKYRYVNVQTIEKELLALRDMGFVSSIYFIDDTLNVPKERFLEILRMMIKNQFEYKWHFNFRCQFADEETVALMKKAGCEGAFLGIESGSDEILSNMNKRSSIEQYREGLRLLNKYGITSYASFIVGFPGETDKTVRQTIQFIEENKPTYFRTQLWYCDPLTPIWREKDKYGIKGSMFQWSHNTMNYEQACTYIEQIFLSIQNSIWLPQNSFEIMSLFYLQRKGMSITQLNSFLTVFNDLIKCKLRSETPNMDEAMKRIKEFCQF